MRACLLCLLLLLPGCAGGIALGAVAGVGAGVEIASIAIFGRSVADIAVSMARGKDCSIVRLDRHLTYCNEVEIERPQAFCTRTLGSVSCWDDPHLAPANAREVGDTPPPTSEQLRYRNARWPKSIFFQG